MPEYPPPKGQPHPWSLASRAEPSGAARRFVAGVPYAELHVTTNFSFLTGASHPEELVEHAAALGHRAVAITDRASLAGIVRAHVAAREAGIPLAVGCRLDLGKRGPSVLPLSVLVYPTDRASYGGLCRLLTLGKRRAPKGECDLSLRDLLEHQEGLLAVLLPPARPDAVFAADARELAATFNGDRLSLAAACLYGEDDRGRLVELAALAKHLDVPLVATNDVHYHAPERRSLQDVLTCIRNGRTLEEAGFRLLANAERHLKPPAEMQRLFAGCPGGSRAVNRSAEVAERASAFRLDELRYQYPEEVCPPGRTPMQHLAELTWAGAAERYAADVPGEVRARIEHEFALIDELAYAPYFLTVHDLVVFARSRGILCQGRGAAANSAVCYCLGVTAVDPDRIDLLFERFVSKERGEPPDIDIDFEHERREEVIQYIYAKYGRERAALTAEVITYRGRSAVREVGKALGLSLDCVDRLAKDMDWWGRSECEPERLRAHGLDPADPTMQRLAALVGEIQGFPRHLSQHVGGFVITQDPLCELVPIENAAMPERTVIEWDKDDIDAMGMLKVDVLGLGMLTCVRKSFELLEETGVRTAGGEPFALHSVPAEDPEVYDMVCEADTIGVFQIESRAQMSMLPRLRPRCFYDLVIEVAIVRPGPIQGDMVHPYLRRRRGEEPVTFPNSEVERVLGKTLGVPLFQEQAMALAIVAAGFTPGEADALRRAMAAWKRKTNEIMELGRRLVSGMLERGYPREFAERCFRQIQGFGEYGFPESHAASFALIVYVSAWLKRHHPAAFAAALINSQPMGFYAPAQIVRDAREHGALVRPVDVNASAWDCLLEDGGAAIRLGMRLVKGLREADATAIVQAVLSRGTFANVEALQRASGVRASALRRLASADAFQSMGVDRQAALWQVRALRDEEPSLFDDAPAEPKDLPPLPAVPPARKVLHDYVATHLSLKAHPMSFLRRRLDRAGVTCAAQIRDEQRFEHEARVSVAGIVLVRQRPGTASGIVFVTIEDETGIANLIVWSTTYERFRSAIRHGTVILVHGRVEREGAVVHVIVREAHSLDRAMSELRASSRDFH